MSLNIKFIVNDNFEISVPGKKDMMFAELFYIFAQKVGLKEDNKASYEFNFQPIKADSMKRLKDLGIEDNSIIKVKTEKPLDRPAGDMGSFYIPQNNFPLSETVTPQNPNTHLFH